MPEILVRDGDETVIEQIGNHHFERQSFTHHHLLIKHADSVAGIHTEAVENAIGFGLQLRFYTRSDRC